MNVACPYCGETVDIDRLADHVRLREGEGHGASGTTPIDHVDNPWNVRLDVDDPPPDAGDREADVPDVEYVREEIRHGRCPACDRGVMALKGGDGFLSRGRRRLACPNCGWESPEWVTVRE